ncbi:MAG: Rieske (2Fe-2S) protein [Solirubrobacteraceae bacterium]
MDSSSKAPSGVRRHVLFPARDLLPGQRRIVDIDGRSVGVFNIAGRIHALHNRCPHKGARLCEGRVCGTTLPTDRYAFQYGRDGELVRCPWHGWEFDIATGQALADTKVRVRAYPVDVEDGQVVITI